jgi:hypothetical protein
MSRKLLAAMAATSLIGSSLWGRVWADSSEPPPAPADLWLPSQDIIELQAGARFEGSPSPTAGADFELPPFISHFVGMRLGASWCGTSENHRYSPDEFGAHAQLTASWWRFELAFGPILLAHEDYYNSSHLNLDLSADGALTQHWRVRVEHWSNAGSSPHNVGRNMVLLDYRF